MSIGYQFDFTYDPSGNRGFRLAPYTTNGPISPNNGSPDSKASSADTTLLLYGKGTPDYGERIQENMVHMLENFSSPDEPVHPIGGQLWFDQSVDPFQLRIFNPKKYQIFDDTTAAPPHGNEWFAITPDGSVGDWSTVSPGTPEEDILDRSLSFFASGQYIRLFNTATGEVEEYQISIAHGEGAAVSTADPSKVIFKVTTMPSSSRATGDWHIGGWETVLQNNSRLYEDLDAGNLWTIKNLADPVDAQDATTRSWVENYVALQIDANNQLGELTDVTITSPSPYDILQYVGGQWVNTDGRSTFLRLDALDGSSYQKMTGSIDMGGNAIHNLPLFPGGNSHAATKAYVDAEIATVSSGTPTTLGSLTDVNLTGLVSGSIITYNGSEWVDTPYGSSPFLQRSGDTMTGALTMHPAYTPSDPDHVATKAYVDNETTSLDIALQAYVNSQISSLPDEDHVVSGTFNGITQELTLNLLQGGSVTVAGFASGGTSSDAVTHNVADPNYEIPNRATGELMLEYTFQDPINYPSYPSVPVSDAITEASVQLGKLKTPKERMVFVTNGNDVVFGGDSSGGAVSGQANPTGALDYLYRVGTEDLEVYVNGVKSINSTAGWRLVTATDTGSPSDIFNLWPATRTGLNPASSYSFNINVNGAGSVVVGPITGTGNVETFGVLVNTINAIADANYFNSGAPDPSYAFGVTLLNGALTFTSALSGTGSSISLSDVNLFSSMGSGGLVTGDFTIDDVTLAETNDPNYSPLDYGYKELGRPGGHSRSFQFVTIPSSGSVVEVFFGHEYGRDTAPYF